MSISPGIESALTGLDSARRAGWAKYYEAQARTARLEIEMEWMRMLRIRQLKALPQPLGVRIYGRSADFTDDFVRSLSSTLKAHAGIVPVFVCLQSKEAGYWTVLKLGDDFGVMLSDECCHSLDELGVIWWPEWTERTEP